MNGFEKGSAETFSSYSEQITGAQTPEELLLVLDRSGNFMDDQVEHIRGLLSDDEDAFDNLPLRLGAVPKEDGLYEKVLDLRLRIDMSHLDTPERFISFLKSLPLFYGVDAIPGSRDGVEYDMTTVLTVVHDYFTNPNTEIRLPRQYGLREHAERIRELMMAQ